MALAQVLSPLRTMFDRERHPGLLAGLEAADDAAVYRLNGTTAVVSTIDFFAPVVDDPYTYGAIAAANALSDVYAMGAEAVLALNVAAFPRDLPAEVVGEILRGGAEKVAEAGAVIAGGHTIWDDEPKYGLSVLGLVHPARLLRKGGLRAGDRLYLTKPLGTGTLLSAAKAGRASPAAVAEAERWMMLLNRHASHLATAARLRAATDVTGFGLLGHLWEMISQAGLQAELELAKVPILEGAVESWRQGHRTGGEGRNREWLEGHVVLPSDDRAGLLFDPQTSGGLLLGCPTRKARALEAAFARDNEPLWHIGRTRAGEPRILIA